MSNLFWEYPTEDAMAKRPVPQPEECFELEGRNFGLLKFRLAFNQQQPFLDLAGHRFPIIHEPGMLERLAWRLKDFRGSVSLGCYRSYDGWRASDGTRIEIRLMDEQGRQIVYDTINYSVLVASDGRLRACNEAVAMLVPTFLT